MLQESLTWTVWSD